MPFFIGGMFKSGTSLARKFIGNHPNIFSGLETNWFYLDNYFQNRNVNIEDLQNTWHAFFQIEKESLKKIINDSKSSEEVLEIIMNLLIKRNNLSDWCEKSPPNITYGKRILNFWPKAKLIHIIRDPFDVYFSLKEAKKWDTPKEFVKN